MQAEQLDPARSLPACLRPGLRDGPDPANAWQQPAGAARVRCRVHGGGEVFLYLQRAADRGIALFGGATFCRRVKVKRIRDSMVYQLYIRTRGGGCISPSFYPTIYAGLPEREAERRTVSLARASSCVPDIPLAHWISRSWNPFRTWEGVDGSTAVRAMRRCLSHFLSPRGVRE